ncbi:MAG: hypothetical protein HYU42_13220 [Candidatus Rokubacteria bacterium]|nr:hypothetical protein [Candidatus Rokubacteria bacterium]MBI3107160.1 hypothetical protein [Candidatus Rokubacteria bacterium]
MGLGQALPLAEELVQALGRVRGVKEVSPAGSVRRGKETVGDIDILATSTSPREVMEAFVALPQVAEVLEKGETKASIRHREGIQVDLRVVAPESFGAALQYFSGSKAHNIRLRDMAVRRAWVEAAHVINTWPVERLKRWARTPASAAPRKARTGRAGPAQGKRHAQARSGGGGRQSDVPGGARRGH